MGEQWKFVWGFSRYMISDMGRIKSRENGLFVTQEAGKDGVLRVTLTANNGVKLVKAVHRLVADSFLYDAEGYSQVYWADGNKQNNALSNIRRKVEIDESVQKTPLSKYMPLAGEVEARHRAEFRGLRGTKNDKSLQNSFADRPPARYVRVIDTGQVYPSQSACAKALGISQSQISAALRGKLKTAHGFRFEYVIEAETNV